MGRKLALIGLSKIVEAADASAFVAATEDALDREASHDLLFPHPVTIAVS
jgi:hypothetical protein